MKKSMWFWDRMAGWYDKRARVDEDLTRTIGRSEKYLAADDTVLDYACGTGVVTDGSYEVTVASDEAKGGCGTSGATVTFVLGGEGDPGGTEADQTGTWDDSQVNGLDITFTTQ